MSQAEIKSKGKSDAETMAIDFEAYVEAVRDWSGDVGIGGDVAVIIMEKEGKRRWFHRPDFCPEK